MWWIVHSLWEKSCAVLKQWTCFGDVVNSKEVPVVDTTTTHYPKHDHTQYWSTIIKHDSQFNELPHTNCASSNHTGQNYPPIQIESPAKTTQMKMEKILKSELPLPTNNEGQPFEEALFQHFTPSKSQTRRKEPNHYKKENIREGLAIGQGKYSKGNVWSVPDLLVKVTSCLEYGLALELSSLEGLQNGVQIFRCLVYFWFVAACWKGFEVAWWRKFKRWIMKLRKILSNQQRKATGFGIGDSMDNVKKSKKRLTIEEENSCWIEFSVSGTIK